MSTPTLTRDQVRELDRRAIEHYGLTGLVLMENAGRGCVDVLLAHELPEPFVIVCGKGNNAGDGFVIARRLELLGRQVRVLLCAPPDELTGDAAANYRILARSDVLLEELPAESPDAWLAGRLAGAGTIVDALLGTGARGDPRPPLDDVLTALNAAPAAKVAIDLPSGLDADTGRPAPTTFRADHTCTFVAAKPGLLTAAAAPYVGRLHVLDIGAPRQLLREFSLETSSLRTHGAP